MPANATFQNQTSHTTNSTRCEFGNVLQAKLEELMEKFVELTRVESHLGLNPRAMTGEGQSG